jgi:hypothetical protein
MLNLVFVLCSSEKKSWKGTLKMPSTIEFDPIIDSSIPQPIMYPSPDNLLSALFAVPFNNAVGTNWLNNAITILHLEPDGIKFQEVRRSFLGQVSGAELSFTSPCDDSWIGYAQTRRFVLFNVKNGDFVKHTIGENLGETIRKIAVVDGSKKKFILDVEYLADKHAKSEGLREKSIRFIRLYDLSGQEPIKLRELEFDFMDSCNPWYIGQGYLWLLNYDSMAINIYNMNLQPVEKHPFIEEYKKFGKFYKEMSGIAVHPSLPFVVLDGISQNKLRISSIASWRDPDQPTIVPFLGFHKDGMFDYIGFSPDGKWLLARGRPPKSVEGDEKAYYYAFPVSEKYPLFLGQPKCLGKIMEKGIDYPSETASCWTTNPTSYVTTTGKIIYQFVIE